MVEELPSLENSLISQKIQPPTTKVEGVSKKRRVDQKKEISNVVSPVEKSVSDFSSVTPSSSPFVSSSSEYNPQDVVALLVPSRLVNPSLFVTEATSPPLQILQQLLNLYVWPMTYSSS